MSFETAVLEDAVDRGDQSEHGLGRDLRLKCWWMVSGWNPDHVAGLPTRSARPRPAASSDVGVGDLDVSSPGAGHSP
jgi:hypothetical protein